MILLALFLQKHVTNHALEREIFQCYKAPQLKFLQINLEKPFQLVQTNHFLIRRYEKLYISSATQTSCNRPLGASTLQKITSQSNEPVTTLITPTLYSQSEQSSASQTLSQATESTTIQSTLSQPIAIVSGDVTTVQPYSFRLGVNQSLTKTINGSSVEIPSLQTQPFSTTSIQVKFISHVFNKFRSANRQ